jgi:hypothetical protein
VAPSARKCYDIFRASRDNVQRVTHGLVDRLQGRSDLWGDVLVENEKQRCRELVLKAHRRNQREQLHVVTTLSSMSSTKEMATLLSITGRSA